MSPKRAAFVLALLFCSVADASSEDLVVEGTEITKEEGQLFQTIVKFDKSFHYSKKAKRYYRIDTETKAKLPILVELVFSKADGLYFGEFISYSVTVQPDSSIVTYAFDAGTANRGEGTVMVTPRGVIKTERSCGVSACIVQIVNHWC